MNNDSLFLQVDQYLRDLFAPSDPVLSAVEANIVQAKLPPISVSPVDGRFIHVLALLCRARSILEIGTLGGYSSIWMARALPADGRLVTIEVNPTFAEVARKNIDLAGLGNRITIRVGRGLDVLPTLEAEGMGPFDMIFIDADKPPYVEYFQWALRLSRPGTLIVADNVIRDGQVLDPDNTDERVAGARRFNAFLAANPHVSAVAQQTVGLKGHDGMALAVVREAARK